MAEYVKQSREYDMRIASGAARAKKTGQSGNHTQNAGASMMPCRISAGR